MGKYIRNLYSRDEKAFTAFSKTGNLTKEHLNKLDISDTRIKNYCRENYIEKVFYSVKNETENRVAYRLTNTGREIASEKFALSNFNQSLSVRHNIDVAEKYMSLSQEERETVLNEREVRELVQEQINSIEQQQERDRYQEMLDTGRMSMPDMIYKTEQGVVIAYETITNNYSEVEIRAKEETCEFLKIEIEMNKI
ncbi:hypothetical protein ACEE21_14970 [Clostridium baratii]